MTITDEGNSYDSLDLQKEANFERRIRNLCGLFIRVADEKVYLIHQTAKEFLIAYECHPTIVPTPSKMDWKHSL